jgi:hypothetical protein
MKNQISLQTRINRHAMALFTMIFMMFSLDLYSQDEVPIYTIVSFMKVKQGEDHKYVQVEKDYWKPMHDELVKQGKILGWYLYKIQFNGTGDEYNYATVTHYMGTEHIGRIYGSNLIAKVHPGHKWEDIGNATLKSRDMVTTRMLQWQLQSLPDDGRAPSKYAVVNYMKTIPGVRNEFFQLRRDYVKPAFDMALKEGKVEGWGMWRLMFPSGEDMPYDFVSGDFYNDLDQLGNTGLGEHIAKLNPDANLEDLWQKMSASRTMTYRELWELVDYAR